MISAPLFGTCAHNPRHNALLAALPESIWQRWQEKLELVVMPVGQVLQQSSAEVDHVYFPTTAVVSLMHVTDAGGSAEVAAVGHQGMVGIGAFMGGRAMPSQAVVQNAGHGFRLGAEMLQDEFSHVHEVATLMVRYTQALLTEIAQTAVCNRHHALEQQLCRWLLRRVDGVQSNELMMTQEVIANLLGVRREGVTEAALKLKAAGLISYGRGHITVLNRGRLMQRSCECYSVVKTECDRLLPPSRTAQLAAQSLLAPAPAPTPVLATLMARPMPRPRPVSQPIRVPVLAVDC